MLPCSQLCLFPPARTVLINRVRALSLPPALQPLPWPCVLWVTTTRNVHLLSLEHHHTVQDGPTTTFPPLTLLLVPLVCSFLSHVVVIIILLFLSYSSSERSLFFPSQSSSIFCGCLFIFSHSYQRVCSRCPLSSLWSLLYHQLLMRSVGDVSEKYFF